MGRIKKVATERHKATLSPAIAEFVSSASSLPLHLLPGKLAEFPRQWPLPRGDLYHWIPLLDRFDDCLEAFNKEYCLNEGPQTQPFERRLLKKGDCSPQNVNDSAAQPQAPPQTIPNDVDLDALGYSQEGDREVVESIVHFTRILLEHCGNRSLYTSSSQINNLLHTTSLSLLNACLKLALRLAQRYQVARYKNSHPHAQAVLLANHYSFNLDNLHKIAMPFPKPNVSDSAQTAVTPSKGKEKVTQSRAFNPSDLVAIAKEPQSLAMKADLASVSIIYYNQPAPHSRPSTAQQALEASPVTPTPVRKTSNLGPSRDRLAMTERSATTDDVATMPGVKLCEADASPSVATAFSIPAAHVAETPAWKLLREALPNLPVELRYDLLNRVRIAKALASSEESSQPLLEVRLLAIANLAYAYGESKFQEKIGIPDSEEPRRYHLSHQLCDLLQPATNGQRALSLETETAVLMAIEALSKLRHKVLEVTDALSITVNHGVLYYELRKVIATLNVEEHADKDLELQETEWREATFDLINTLQQSNTAARHGERMVSAGIMGILVEALSLRTNRAERFHEKILSFFASFIHNIPSAFQTLANIKGFDALADLTQYEVESSLQAAKSENGLPKNLKSKVVDYDIPYYQQSTLRQLFKFTVHMFEHNAGTHDRLLRNLIDTPQILGALRSVIENANVFGSNVWSGAVNIMSSFIHNEPTSYQVIGEAGLSRSFLESITEQAVPDELLIGANLALTAADMPSPIDFWTDGLPQYPEVRGILPVGETMCDIPNAFGAICLNGDHGMKMFQASKALVKYFDIFVSPTHVRALEEEGQTASAIGNAFDELSRHQPELKEPIIMNVINMVKRVADLCANIAVYEGVGAKLWERGANSPASVAGGHDALKGTPQDVFDESRENCTPFSPTKDSDPVYVYGEGVREHERERATALPFLSACIKFLEGFFHNQSMCSLFCVQDGVEILLDLMLSPSNPFDITAFPIYNKISQVLRSMCEAKPHLVLPSLLRRLENSLVGVAPILREGFTGTFNRFKDLTTPSGDPVDGLWPYGGGMDGTTFVKCMCSINVLTDVLQRLLAPPNYSSRHNSPTSQLFISLNFTDVYIRLVEKLGRLRAACVWEKLDLVNGQDAIWKDKTEPRPFVMRRVDINGFVELATESRSAENQVNGIKAETTGDNISNEALEIKNIKTLRYLLVQTPSSIESFFNSLGQALVPKRTTEAATKQHASLVADQLAKTVLWEVDFKKFGPDYSSDKYVCQILTAISRMMLRNSYTMETYGQKEALTLVLNKFYQHGGLTKLNEWLQRFVDVLAQGKEPTKELYEAEIPVCDGLRAILDFYSHIVRSKCIVDAFQSGPISVRDSKLADYFMPGQFLVEIRDSVFPAVSKLWYSSAIERVGDNHVKTIIEILRVTLKGDGEDRALKISDHASQRIQTSRPEFALRNTVGVATLQNEGYETSLAREAVYRCNNHESQAREYCALRKASAETPAPRFPIPEGEPAPFSTLQQDTVDMTDAAVHGQEQRFDLPAQQATTTTITTSDLSSDANTMSDDDQHGIPADIGEQDLMELVGDARLQDILNLTQSNSSFNISGGTSAGPPSKDTKKPFVTVDDLDERRSAFRDSLIDRCLEVLSAVPTITFELADLIQAAVAKSGESANPYEEIGKTLVSSLLSLHGEEGPAASLKIYAYAHLVALILQDRDFFRSTVDELTESFSALITWVELAHDQKAEDAPWIEMVLLIIERVLAEDEQPRELIWDPPPSDDPLKPLPEPKLEPVSIPISLREQLFNVLVNTLPKIGKNSALALSVSRVLVQLTRRRELAIRLSDRHAMSKLFLMVRQLAGSVNEKLHGAFMLILRHMVEDKQIIRQIMETEIKAAFDSAGHRSSRGMDTHSYTRNLYHLVLRDPELFVEVSKDMLEVPRYDGHPGRAQTLALKRETPAAAAAQEAKAQGDSLAPFKQSTEETAPETQEVAETKPPVIETTDGVVAFLLRELSNYKDVEDRPAVPGKDEERGSDQLSGATNGEVATPDASSSSSSIVEPSSVDSSKSDKPAFKPEEHSICIYRCFVLQCLAELLASYTRTKVEFINFSRKPDTQPATPSKPRAGTLNYLLNTLIPVGTLEHKDDIAHRKKISTSNWATTVIVSLCAKTQEKNASRKGSESVSTEDDSDLTFVRRFVLEHALRAFKDATTSTEPLDQRYSKLLGLGELFNRMLNTKVNRANTADANVITSQQIGRLMYEKNFIGALTAAVAELDLNFPNAKRAVKYLLGPLRLLTDLGVILSQDSEIPSSAFGTSTDEDEVSSATSLSEEGHEEREQTPDLFRGSVLGMVESGGPSAGHSESDSEDEDDDEMFDDDGYGDELEFEGGMPEHGDVVSDEDEEINGMGDVEGVPGDVDMDVEIVMDGEEADTEEDDDDDEDEDDADEDDDEDEDGDEDPEFVDRMDLEEITGDDENASLADQDEAGVWEEDEDADFDEQDNRGGHSPHGGPLEHITHVIRADEHSDPGEQDGLVHIDMGDGDEEYFEDEMPPDEEDEEDEEGYENDVVYEPELEEEDEDDEGMGLGWDAPPPPGAIRPTHHHHHHHHHHHPFPRDFGQLFGMVGGDHFRPPTFRTHRPASNTRGEDDGTNPLLHRGGSANSSSSRDDAPYSRWTGPRTGLPGRGEALIQDLVATVGASGNNVHISVDGAMHGLPPIFSFQGRAGAGLIDIDTSRPLRDQLRLPFGDLGPTLHRVNDTRNTSAGNEAQAVEFHPIPTMARWQEEARILFGSKHHDKATRIVNTLMRLLIPPAMQAKKEHDEAERVRRAEEEKVREESRKKEEAEKAEREAREEKEREEREAEEAARREQLEREARETHEAEGAESAEMEGVESGENEAPVEEPAADVAQQDEPPAERITTTIRGRELDITTLGIDREFLDAIPEEMREDVIMQQLQVQRSQAVQSGEQPSEISREFLEALPREIQRELLRQEADERRRRERSEARRRTQQDGSTQPAQPEEMNNADFMAMLDPGLRQTILMDADENTLATLPEDLQAEARALLGDRLPRMGQGIRRIGDGNSIRVVNASGRPVDQAAEQSNKQRRPVIQMLDKAGVATLLRLMFVSLHHRAKTNLHSILSDVCKNTQNRAEVISILLSILQDGTADLGAVERSFAQLSLRAKQLSSARTPQPLKRTLTGQVLAPTTELSPLNIVQQCLATLNALVADNARVPSFFLTEHETITSQKAKVVKKGKGREGKAAKYPLNALLTLLDRKLITENTGVMETLAALLSRVTHPLTILPRKAKEAKAADQPAAETSERNEGDSRPDTATSDVQMGGAPSNEPSAAGEAAEQQPEDGANGDHVSKSPTDTTAAKSEDQRKHRELVPPDVPEENIRLVVNILAARECPSKTFSDTLDIIKNLSAIPGAKEVFGKELVRQSQELGQAVLLDLEELANQINSAQTGTDLQGLALANFSSSGSKQRKLLRVILALDHLFDPKRTPQSPTSQFPMDPKVKDDVLTALYESSTFEKLWSNLTVCLAAIRRRGNMVNVATILLPLIESFMVVCRNITLKETPTSVVVTSPVEASATTSLPESRVESLFFRFTEENRKILNELIRNNPKLMSGHLSVLAKNPKVLEFDNKRTYFNRKIHQRGEGRHSHPSLQLSVRRDQVFLDSFKSLYYKNPDEIKYGKLNIRFHGEEGIDAGGVSREWFAAMARQMFNADYALFNPVASDRTTFHPSPLSFVNPEHLMFFKFIGRIIGKALYEGRVLDCHFSRAVYRRILGKSVSLKDMESLDLEYYKSLVWILENQIDGVTFETFSVERDEFGATETIDLVDNGRNIEVTDANKADYVQKVVEYRLVGSVQAQLDEFLGGFHDIIPAELVSIFNEQELELLISGLPDIDIDDWRHNTEYHNYQSTSPQVQWFWRAVRSFDKEEKAKLLQFVTGTSKVPLNGFKELEGMNGFAKFNIHRDYSSKEKLPTSHTCFNQLDLPEYESYEHLRQQLYTAITAGSEYFGFA